MTTSSPSRARTSRRRGSLASVAGVLVGLACAAPPAGVVAQPANNPIVQVICQVNGGVAKTVRVTYPATAVKNVHVFTPVSGGANVVFYAPSTANQVYTLAVPAGSYKLMYQPLGSGITMFYYNPVIVIPPFKVVGRMCQRRQAVGTPSS
ncbi:MAG: hypothetical protein K9G59_12450 [Caulobacter sp.]|nr:hypothetical protein [Caulobacter sp.]